MKAQAILRPKSLAASGSRRSQAAIDFTMMYVTHDAFRRDLRLLVQAAWTGDIAGFQGRWSNFKAQLLVHHSVEDANLWPVVRVAASGRAGAVQVLDDMEREHGQLEPLLDAVDHALTTRAGPLAELVGQLEPELTTHLEHEEREALPLIRVVCTATDWRRFASHMRRRQGVRGAATYVPWVLDRLDEADRRRFFAVLPPPVRFINRLVWEPRYRRRLRSSP